MKAFFREKLGQNPVLFHNEHALFDSNLGEYHGYIRTYNVVLVGTKHLFWKFKIKFSCVRTDVKMRLHSF